MPKLADAWIQLGTKGMGDVNRGLNDVRSQVDKTGRKFDDVRIVGERTWHRLGSAIRRVLGDLKRAARGTEEGKTAVDDFEASVGGLYNAFTGIIGLDLPGFFDVLAAGIKAVTAGTAESEHFVLSWERAWLGLSAVIANVQGDAKRMLELAQEAIRVQSRLDALQNEMTKRDVNNAQKRGDAAKKEARDKRVSLMSIEDLWLEVQRQMSEGGGGGKRAQPQPKPKVIPAGAGPQPVPKKPLTEEQKDRMAKGARQEEIDRLKQSSNPNERRRGYQMEEYDRGIKERDRENKGSSAPPSQDELDRREQESNRKIREDSAKYEKEATEKQNDLLLKSYIESVKQREATEKLIKTVEKNPGGLR